MSSFASNYYRAHSGELRLDILATDEMLRRLLFGLNDLRCKLEAAQRRELNPPLRTAAPASATVAPIALQPEEEPARWYYEPAAMALAR